MTYEYESNGACPFCGLRGCGHDRTKYQGPFGIAPKVSAPALTSVQGANEVARPSADETGANFGSGTAMMPNLSAASYTLCDDGATSAGGRPSDPAPISAYDEPVEPPPTVVAITPKVGVERVLQGIEKRTKRKKAEQGNLF